MMPMRDYGLTLADVSESTKHYSFHRWANSSIAPDHAAVLSMRILCMASGCSGKCVVPAVVTSLCVSNRITMGDTMPVQPTQNPCKAWHVPKQFINAYSSVMWCSMSFS